MAPGPPAGNAATPVRSAAPWIGPHPIAQGLQAKLADPMREAGR